MRLAICCVYSLHQRRLVATLKFQSWRHYLCKWLTPHVPNLSNNETWSGPICFPQRLDGHPLVTIGGCSLHIKVTPPITEITCLPRAFQASGPFRNISGIPNTLIMYAVEGWFCCYHPWGVSRFWRWNVSNSIVYWPRPLICLMIYLPSQLAAYRQLKGPLSKLCWGCNCIASCECCLCTMRLKLKTVIVTVWQCSMLLFKHVGES